MIDEKTHDTVPPYARHSFVAEFSDGARLRFYGPTEAGILDAIAAAVPAHGDVLWYDGVTDQQYEHGQHYRLVRSPGVTVARIDLREYNDAAEKE